MEEEYMNDALFKGRNLGRTGLDLYFYNLRTLMIYKYEIQFQLENGIWSSSRYPEGHFIPWIEANLHLTNGKGNSRNVVEIGCNIPKNDYNLKKILNVSTAYNRVKSIGKLVKSLDDKSELEVLFNEGFHEDVGYYLNDESEYSDELYKMLMDSITHCGKLGLLVTPDLIQKYMETDYSDKEMRDDLGMIQVTMRNTITLQY